LKAVFQALTVEHWGSLAMSPYIPISKLPQTGRPWNESSQNSILGI
jgi:hypothetical protein